MTRIRARVSISVLGIGTIFLFSVVSFAQQRNRSDYKQLPTVAVDTNEIYVQLDEGTDVHSFAKENGLEFKRTFMSNANRHVLVASTVQQANELVSKLEGSSQVQLVGNNQRVNLERYWTPNDPYFGMNRLGGQWHLKNDIPGSGGVSSKAMGAWAQGFTGAGVQIGIVDDGIEHSHADLSPNYNAAYSYDFGQGDFDPSPVGANDNHGTAVSGIAAAKGGNGIGGTGAAPNVSFSGIRLDFAGGNTVADVADATAYQNANIQIKNHSYGVTQLFYDNPLVNNVISNQSPNTIHVYAAGNSRLDVGKRHTASNPNTIMVGAVGYDGVRSVYTQYGAPIMVVAPTSDHDLFPTYTTTTVDRAGSNGYNDATGTDYNNSDGLANPTGYTGRFGGTSSAAPLVTGILALAQEANPDMNVRVAKHLLVMTSQKVDLTNNDPQSDGGWRANGAGHLINQNYGFGVIDAEALVEAAVHYTELSDLEIESTGIITVNRDIDTNASNTTIAEQFTLGSDTPLEDVLVTLNFDHDWRGDLEAYLTSPSGFRSRLFRQYGSDTAFGNFEWTFRTVGFWGEEGQGTWTLEMVDTFTGDAGGTLNWFSVDAYRGTLSSTAVPEPSSVIFLGLASLAWLGRRRRKK